MSPIHEPVHHIVFAADGAGNFQRSSSSLRALVEHDHTPLDVVTYEWSHGYGRVLADQIGYAYARAQGERLAAEILELYRCHPQACIYVMGHSAGAAVALAAAEALPPGVLQGMVLLAPSISASYDLRPALSRTRAGIDVYYSRADWFYLGVATRLAGTADRSHGLPAGRIGFRVYADSPDDACLYSKLRQHAWERADRALGHTGGHYGAYQPAYMRTNVIPAFFSAF
jgi:pimeloyl-ACP methyl ester carboxylesterase